MALIVERVAAPTAELRDLIAGLDRALTGPYKPEQRHALSYDELFQDHVRMFMARLDGVAVGCGGVALLDGFAEVKRMFTRPAARRLGVARAIMERLESEARSAGYALLRLETGMYQRESMAFYERAGFRRRDPFGDYLSLPPDSIATSLFYEKSLG
jgi:putative acetyltransferase